MKLRATERRRFMPPLYVPTRLSATWFRERHGLDRELFTKNRPSARTHAHTHLPQLDVLEALLDDARNVLARQAPDLAKHAHMLARGQVVPQNVVLSGGGRTGRPSVRGPRKTPKPNTRPSFPCAPVPCAPVPCAPVLCPRLPHLRADAHQPAHGVDVVADAVAVDVGVAARRREHAGEHVDRRRLARAVVLWRDPARRNDDVVRLERDSVMVGGWQRVGAHHVRRAGRGRASLRRQSTGHRPRRASCWAGNGAPTRASTS